MSPWKAITAGYAVPICLCLILAFALAGCWKHDDGAGDLWRIPKHMKEFR